MAIPIMQEEEELLLPVLLEPQGGQAGDDVIGRNIVDPTALRSVIFKQIDFAHQCRGKIVVELEAATEPIL